MNKKVISLFMIMMFLFSFAGQAFCEEESITIKYTKYQAEKKRAMDRRFGRIVRSYSWVLVC